jgi:hypothetical protein
VLWERRDTFTGEDQPPTVVELPWHSAAAAATDTFGQAIPVQLAGTSLRLPVSDTPIYLEEAR